MPAPPLHPAVRFATPLDVAAIVQLIKDLAAYERSSDHVKITEQRLHAALFGPTPVVFALVAEAAPRHDVAGFALYFVNFSTWEGLPGIYLEDLYVRPEHRGQGLGKALFQSLAAIAVDRGYARFDWAVLDWNTPAIDFYRSLGAAPLTEWTGYRLSGPALRAAATGLGSPIRTPPWAEHRSDG